MGGRREGDGVGARLEIILSPAGPGARKRKSGETRVREKKATMSFEAENPAYERGLRRGLSLTLSLATRSFGEREAWKGFVANRPHDARRACK